MSENRKELGGNNGNRYAHLVASKQQAGHTQGSVAALDNGSSQRVQTWVQNGPGSGQKSHKCGPPKTVAGGSHAPTLRDQSNALGNSNSNNNNNSNVRGENYYYKNKGTNGNNYYYASFSNVDWREQWTMFKERTMEKVERPDYQRKLIMLIVCTALLLDNMLYMVIVPIIPDYLRSIGAWSTYTENAKWIRRNSSHGRAQWEQVGGQVVYEGEDSAVGFLFASKAIVQLIANPFSGAIADRIGYEIPMMFGLTVMFLSTMVFACGQTYSVLFLARSLQGVGSAFADTPGIALLADRFSEETERRRAQGIAIAFISFGCLVAPPFGSVLYQGAGKEVPFILLSLVCLIDGSLLLLVTPPGTFSQIWPRYAGGASAAAGPPPRPPREQVGAPPETTGASSVQRRQLAAGQEATSGEGDQWNEVDCSPGEVQTSMGQVTSAGQIQIGTGQGQKSTGQNPKQEEEEEARQKLQRQKSISRRHSITMSAGEAPKGTPIEVLLRDPCILCCAGALVVANISLAFLEPTISIWVKSSMPETEEWQEGLIWLPAFFPHVLGVFATLHFAEKYPQATWKIAASGLIIEGLGCLVVPFCSSFWSLIIPISVICFGVALIDTAILPTLGYLVDTRFTSVYGNVYAIADISYSLSYAVGPIIAGGIVEAIGFTALNFLIAIVTLGYTPTLMMLRTIRDYQPFAADPSGRAAGRERPFGQFGRKPAEADQIEATQIIDKTQIEATQIQANQQQLSLAKGKYESPGWLASGGGGGHAHSRPGALRKAPSASAGAPKSVTITDAGNPFLGEEPPAD